MYTKLISHFRQLKYERLDILFLLVLTSSLIIRVLDLNYNSAFNDEAIYVVVGKMGLFTGDWWSYGANLWMAGLPYIYPPLTASAYQIGGLIASRLLNSLFGLILVEEVYRLTQLIDLFDPKTNKLAAIIAAFFAGISGVGIFVSNLATYDILSFLLLIFAINSFLKAAYFENGKYYLLCSIALLGAFFTKIIIGAFFPLLFILAVFSLKKRSQKHQKLAIIYLISPFFLGMLLYVIFQSGNLITFFLTHKDNGRVDNLGELFALIWEITEIVLLTSIASLPIIWRRKKTKKLLVLLSLALVIPVFHLTLKREQTLNKHLYLTVIFLSIISSYGFSILLTTKLKLLKLLSGLTLIFIGTIFTANSLKTLNNLQHEWKDTSSLESFLNENVKTDDKILTENGGAVVLSLYDTTFPPKNIVTFDWIDYSNMTGHKAYVQAVRDVYFDYIELDGRFEEKDDLRSIILEEIKDNYSLIYNKDNFLVYGKNTK